MFNYFQNSVADNLSDTQIYDLKPWASIAMDFKKTNSWKTKKYHIVGTVPKANRKIVERDKIDTANTHNDCNDNEYSY